MRAVTERLHIVTLQNCYGYSLVYRTKPRTKTDEQSRNGKRSHQLSRSMPKAVYLVGDERHFSFLAQRLNALSLAPHFFCCNTHYQQLLHMSNNNDRIVINCDYQLRCVNSQQ